MNITEELRKEILLALNIGRELVYFEAHRFDEMKLEHRPMSHNDQYNEDVKLFDEVIYKLNK
jgi:hypothetical protein